MGLVIRQISKNDIKGSVFFRRTKCIEIRLNYDLFIKERVLDKLYVSLFDLNTIGKQKVLDVPVLLKPFFLDLS